jgi:glycerol dehydrogenase
MLRAFGSPGLYLQGPGALARLAEVMAPLGRRAFVVIDPIAAERIGADVEARLGCEAGRASMAVFSGECTATEIDRLVAHCDRDAADVILGIGGGKAIDSAKGVQIATGKPLIVIPTIASTDAPTSRLCVVYTADHAPSEVRMMAANPAVVLVDTEVLVRAPVRFFAAGVGDALSKKFEATQCYGAGGLNFHGFRPPALALHLADQCYSTILTHGEAALAAVRAQRLDESFERTIEATILMSGLAFESGGLSVPHSLTRGLATVPELSGALHGEQVAFGLIVHLLLEGGDSAHLDRLVPLYRALGLPLSLSDLGYTDDPAPIIPTIAQTTIERAPYIRNFASEITQDRLEAALHEAQTLFGTA